MGNSLEAPVTEKDTVRFERAGSAVKAERHDGHKGPDKEIVRRVAPGDDFMDGIAAAACSMQGWRCSMEDRLCARMDLEGRPLGAHHIFCLFDGHGGDSVAEYCQVHLADRIVRRIQNAHDLRSAAAAVAAPGVTFKSSEEGNIIRRDTGAGRSSGGKGPRGCGVPVDSDVCLVTDCVREACREVDKEVKGKFFTPTGRYVAPRMADLLDVTPPPQQTLTPPWETKEDDVGQARATSMEEGLEKAELAHDLRTAVTEDGADGGDVDRKTATRHGVAKSTSSGRTTSFRNESSSRRSRARTASDTRDADEGGSSQEAFSTCGTTSLIVIISEKFVICCNTGDSRAVLASEGASTPLSTDHKPENQAERRRIEAAGGRVKHNRVEGKLAVSRCIGDHPFKSDPKLPLERQMVVCDPEVTVIPRSDADEFVIMACDGVWDVMGNDEACFFLRKAIQEGSRDLGKILQDLEDACLAKQSMDNMSVLVIAFKAAWEEGLHLHRSARYVLHWGCAEVSKWLSNNNFGQYQDDFEKFQIDGAGLLSLTEADLLHKLHLKKVGLRKKLWQKLSPLRLGYLAWTPRDLAAWLGHVGIQEFQQMVTELGIDGRALGLMSKGELRLLARRAALGKLSRWRLYTAVDDLKAGGGDGEWVALFGMLDGRFNGGSDGRDGSGNGRGNPDGDAWPRSPRPRSFRSSASVASASASSSSSSSDDSNGAGDGAGDGRGGKKKVDAPDPGACDVRASSTRRYRHRFFSKGEEWDAGEEKEAEKKERRDSRGVGRENGTGSLTGQASGMRKGSASSFALNGARRLSRVLRRHSPSQPDLAAHLDRAVVGDGGGGGIGGESGVGRDGGGRGAHVTGEHVASSRVFIAE
ncbi:unnamed protein product [Scytosiphon promiscuus]